MLKATISQILRKLGLLHCADRINFLFEYFKTRKANRKFVKGNSGIKIPPPYMMYESFNLKYKNYYEGGASSAKWLIEHLKNIQI